MGDISWSSTQAAKEGWSIFQTDDGDLNIQRLDCPADHSCEVFGELPLEPVFETDEKALDFVISRAKQGSRYHLDSLWLHVHGDTWSPDPIYDTRKLEYRAAAYYRDTVPGAGTVFRSGHTTQHDAYVLADKLQGTRLFRGCHVQRHIQGEDWVWDEDDTDPRCLQCHDRLTGQDRETPTHCWRCAANPVAAGAPIPSVTIPQAPSIPPPGTEDITYAELHKLFMKRGRFCQCLLDQLDIYKNILEPVALSPLGNKFRQHINSEILRASELYQRYLRGE